jgi:hypothetical protein
MRKWIVFVAILAFTVAACSPLEGVDQGSLAAPQDTISSQPGGDEGPGSQPPSSDHETIQEASSGPLTARIFSAPETTINQREFMLQGWANRAGVVSANDIIITNAANETFSIKLTLEDGPNLIEVIVSDRDGNEVRFELIVYVEQ